MIAIWGIYEIDGGYNEVIRNCPPFTIAFISVPIIISTYNAYMENSYAKERTLFVL